MTALAWIAALVIVGLGMMVLEVFVPSGGVLGFLSVVALVAGVATAFAEQGPWFGMAVLAATCVAAPVVLGLAFRIFPDTPLGRRVLPPPPRPDDVVPDAERKARLRELVGATGMATSDLLPFGTVDVAGRVLDAVSEGGPVSRGSVVTVSGVQAAAIVVRPALVEAPAERPSATGSAVPAAAAAPRNLEEALESFDFRALGSESPPGNTPPAGKLDSGPRPKQA